MSTISNKFFIQVIEDGTTLHGELRATKSLTQAYKDGQCIPDWAGTTSSRPLIYLSLFSGSTMTPPDNGYKWFYNGTEIEFSSTTTTANIGGTTYSGFVDTSHGGVFFKTTYSPTLGTQTLAMPALGIIGNLATSFNVDIDVISFEGTKTFSTSPVSFRGDINVTITEWVAGGYLGVIEFANGKADITRDNLSVMANAILYSESGVVSSGVTYKWFINDASAGTGQSITITESQVVDYATLRCEFWYTVDGESTQVSTAYAGVDDTQDPEYLYIQYNGANGNSASLRSGESVTFSMWVGKADDPTVDSAWKTATFKVKILDSLGATVMATDFDSIGAPDANGYRTLTTNSSGVATARLTYDDVYTRCKKGLTGIVLVETATA